MYVPYRVQTGCTDFDEIFWQCPVSLAVDPLKFGSNRLSVLESFKMLFNYK